MSNETNTTETATNKPLEKCTAIMSKLSLSDLVTLFVDISKYVKERADDEHKKVSDLKEKIK